MYNADLDIYTFSIPSGEDSICFIKTGVDVDTPRPTLIFCQGSLPTPLIIDFGHTSIVAALGNFDYKSIFKDFNVILITKPFTPVMATEKELNSQYCYITNPDNKNSLSKDYLAANFMETYIERGNTVVDFLLKQKWVDTKNIFVVGHSEGVKVATKLASTNPNIKGLGFLSGNPLGRIDQSIRELRDLEKSQAMPKDEVQNRINDIYAMWKTVCDNKDKDISEGGDTPKTIYSFSQPVLSDLLELDIPIFVAYGTADIVSSYCDLLPIYFIQKGKQNWKVKPYSGLEHNFFEVDDTGKPNYDKDHWGEVMGDYIEWLGEICEK